MTNKSFEKDIIYPPTKGQIEELKAHNVGSAIRLASKLNRPLTDQEYAMFKKDTVQKVYKVVELPNNRFGVV
jgi:hypothetical protein